MSQKKKILEKRRKEAELKKAAAQKKMTFITVVSVFALVVLVIAGALVFDALKKKANEVNYSAGLEENGYIKGVNVDKYIKLCEFDHLNTNPKDYYPSQEEEDEYIASIIAANPAYSEEKDIVVKTADTVNIDFVGKVDGVMYEGGSTDNKGLKCQIGSDMLPGDLESKIVGHKTGETFDATVHFPDDFANEEIAGKDVVYTVTVNGMYKDGEFNDEFVKKYLSGENATSAEAFLNAYRMGIAKDNFATYLKDFIITESEVITYPTSYTKKVQKLMKNKELEQFNAINEAYSNINGKPIYDSILDMRNMTQSEYDEHIKSVARDEVKKNLVYQALAQKYSVTVTDEDMDACVSSLGFAESGYETAVARYGVPYVNQQAIIVAVDRYIKENFTLE
ncbi:MAG: FKBP-type peptidyl-prolyl cis-trans isomerase [Lachnospiraceae bacterium]|nr:FKBP-type peptidyl-prolyl cis-trans isomerase [Lachnospiraceae bacterium]